MTKSTVKKAWPWLWLSVLIILIDQFTKYLVVQHLEYGQPVKALPFGPPSTKTLNRSAIKGVRKWTSNAEKCFGFWAKLASDCAICMRVCPFNRDYTKRRHRLWQRLALSPARKLALWMDKTRPRQKPSQWWQDTR